MQIFFVRYRIGFCSKKKENVTTPTHNRIDGSATFYGEIAGTKKEKSCTQGHGPSW